MFTGIVEETGSIESIIHGEKSLTLNIKCSFASELVLGESVAVNGTCLTVTQKTDLTVSADVTPESFRRTSLGELSSGSPVNLERAMKADGRFGGHIVSGHIDGTGNFISVEKEENAVNIRIRVDSKLGRYIIEKGSVCIDGISLTVVDVKYGDFTEFSVSVIPHTWANTTLSKKSIDSILNIECDVVGKYIEHFINRDGAGSKNNCVSSENDDALLDMMNNFTSFH